ncbi:MAG: glycosyltransferase [Acidobacteriota bacterium]
MRRNQHQAKIIEFPPVAPIPGSVFRPFWSVMIPTYNCADYLAETLKSVLVQDPGTHEMQIEVVDDFSTKDHPEEVVRDIGRGRVAFYRQPANVGAIRNFNTCLDRSIGHVVHILHADDTVLPGFYDHMRAAFESDERVGAAFCRSFIMDEHSQWRSISNLERDKPGVLADWLAQIMVSSRILFPAITVRRRVYENTGGFHPELFHCADWDMWKRVALCAKVWFNPQVLACYRVHGASDTSQLSRTGANVSNTRLAINISRTYLPAQQGSHLYLKAMAIAAQSALGNARQMISSGGEISGAFAQIREGLKCSLAPNVLWDLFLLLLWAGGLWTGRLWNGVTSRKDH